VVIAGKKTRPAQVRLTESLTHQSRLEIVLQEGRNRQIRLTAEQLGYPVLKLHRTAIGSIQLQTAITNLQAGEYRYLTNEEIGFLNQQIRSSVPINKINQVSKGA